MASKGRDPVRSRIKINNNVTEKINTFNYPVCSIAYHNLKYITVKMSKFVNITGIINRPLTPSLVQKHARLKIYNA